MIEMNFAGCNSRLVSTNTSAVRTEILREWHWKQGNGKETNVWLHGLSQQEAHVLISPKLIRAQQRKEKKKQKEISSCQFDRP